MHLKVHQTGSQLVGVELGRIGGLGDFRTALGAICQKSKPFPICASPFAHFPFITTSAIFLLVLYTSVSLFPHQDLTSAQSKRT